MKKILIIIGLLTFFSLQSTSALDSCNGQNNCKSNLSENKENNICDKSDIQSAKIENKSVSSETLNQSAFIELKNNNNERLTDFTKNIIILFYLLIFSICFIGPIYEALYKKFR